MTKALNKCTHQCVVAFLGGAGGGGVNNQRYSFLKHFLNIRLLTSISKIPLAANLYSLNLS